MQARLRALPSVDQMLATAPLHDLSMRYGRPATLDAVRAVLDDYRALIRRGGDAPMPALMHDDVRLRLEQLARPTLYPAINATGVIVHTNLGRAPLSAAALKAMQAIGGVYSNLEYDVAAGERGSRTVHATRLLTRLTGAEDALVVNNNAAALMLGLAAFARGREVIISRGQLVEIGGGFRIPEIMEQSGATLVEVGTTNRTRIADYENAITERTALLLHVHASNFRIVGFTESASLAEMAALAKQRGLVLLNDLGSGALLDTAAYGLAHEPTPGESLQAGADIVCFSGDKLLGGPQAGLIAGRKETIARLRKHPMTRALRVDKVTLAALQATLLHYVKDEALKEVPVWRMIAAQPDALRERASGWLGQLAGDWELVEGHSTIGGGSLPEETLPTILLAYNVAQPNAFAAELRRAWPPVVARVEHDQVLFDPRTVLPEQDAALIAGIRAAQMKQAGL
ncbi:MAG: L-seryl-tRNA(Sec) selenium transferase [Chloroflexi bacterium]|nr:L-seryl-tRNA(Sec) selenium transferase [Chloroflexota bacterium]